MIKSVFVLVACLCYLSSFIHAIPNFNKEPICKNYKCSRGSLPVPKSGLVLKAGGCNALTNSMGGSFGGRVRQPEVETCCNIFQACLSICGIKRKSCSDEFGKCTKRACASISNAEEKESCSRDLNLHTMLINLGGCKPFDEAQASSCRCVSEKKIQSKQRKILSSFWAKHNKKKTEQDVDKVLAKYSKTPTSFAKLLFKLVRKYKGSIKVTRSPYEDQLDEILKRARQSHGGSQPKPKFHEADSTHVFDEPPISDPVHTQEDEPHESQDDEDDAEVVNLDEHYADEM